MLVELRAENYAVIDHAIAAFGPGLNLLTGETGAGKSILVDALALLMVGKSSAELVRPCAAKSFRPARAAYSSTTSRPPSPSSASLPLNWRWSTRRAKPVRASTRPSSAPCSTASAASRPTPSPRPT